MKNISNNSIVIGIVGLIVGLVLGWLMGNGGWGTKEVPRDDDGSEKAAGTENSLNALLANSSPSQESDSAIFVVDQGAGNVATVASVETDVSAWVVVREDKNGVVGNILGASRVDSGASNNIVIYLLVPTTADKTYRVVLFKDDGDRKFDYRIDVPLTSGGVLISKSFKTLAQ
ncbi:MAG: hypothetical protein AAB635_00915 [Patescibacteria group bacterium]